MQNEGFKNFVESSSEIGGKLDLFWDNTLKPLFDLMAPLNDAAEGLVKLLKLLP